MNRYLIALVLMASCGNVTADPPSSDAGGAGGEAGASSGGSAGAAAGAPGQGGASAKGGATGAGGQAGAAEPPPACSGITSTTSVAVSWCGKNCATCSLWQTACTFPTVDVTDNNGSTATCDLNTDLTSPNFTLAQQGNGWLFTGGSLAAPCKTIPAFTCAPSCAACPTQ